MLVQQGAMQNNLLRRQGESDLSLADYPYGSIVLSVPNKSVS